LSERRGRQAMGVIAHERTYLFPDFLLLAFAWSLGFVAGAPDAFHCRIAEVSGARERVKSKKGRQRASNTGTGESREIRPETVANHAQALVLHDELANRW
jgi:hypothetical protein